MVDVAVASGRIASAAVSGDFFLEPPEALDDIVTALVGMPADAGVAALTRAVEDGLRDGAELIGFSPEAVATAVHRALAGDSPRERL